MTSWTSGRGGAADIPRCLPKIPLYRVVPYEGMIETLDALKRRGIRLAVCTNKPHQAAVETVEGIFGRGYFDGIQGQCDSVRRKPAPRRPTGYGETFWSVS